MSKYDGASIEVVNWDKYNPRTDSKRPTWFRLDKDVALGQGFFGLDCEQKWLWVVILSMICGKSGDPMIWNSAYVSAITGIKSKKQDETIDIFVKFARLRVSRTDLPVELEVTPDNLPTTNITNEHNEQDITNTTERAPQGFDFDVCYQAYPRRVGKSEGLARARKLISTVADYDAFCRAIKNYTQYIQAQGTEEKYIKHFSSFVGVRGKEPWRDWLDPSTGITSTTHVPENSATRRMRGNAYALQQALASIGADDEQAS